MHLFARRVSTEGKARPGVGPDFNRFWADNLSNSRVDDGAIQLIVPGGRLGRVMSFVQVSGAADVAARRRDQPWYRSKTDPAFSDMITALRRQVIEHRISCRVPELGLRRLNRENLWDRFDMAA